MHKFRVAFTGLAILGVLLPYLPAQEPPEFGPGEIYVDQQCRVFVPGPSTSSAPNSTPHFRSDKYVCHIESPHESTRWVENVQNGVVKHKLIRIFEKEYVLSGPSDTPVTFYVEQPLPKGGWVDSDPQPVSVQNSLAVFQVLAQPGQTVRLHIGIRY